MLTIPFSTSTFNLQLEHPFSTSTLSFHHIPRLYGILSA